MSTRVVMMYHEGQWLQILIRMLGTQFSQPFKGIIKLRCFIFWIKSTFWSTPTSLLSEFEEDMNGDRM